MKNLCTRSLLNAALAFYAIILTVQSMTAIPNVIAVLRAMRPIPGMTLGSLFTLLIQILLAILLFKFSPQIAKLIDSRCFKGDPQSRQN